MSDMKRSPANSGSADDLEAHRAKPNAADKSWVAWAAAPGNRTKIFVLLGLLTQNAAYTLYRRYSQGILKETASASSMLLAGELFKLVVSIYAVLSWEGATSAPAGPDKVKYLMARSLPMVVPALVYLGMNLLSYVALERIDAGTFTIFAQMKLITTAICSVVFLKRSRSLRRWRALLLMVLATMIISLHDKPINSSDSELWSWLIGAAAVLLEVTLSGFVSVYFEKVLKGSELSVWDRNLQLAVYSCFIYYPLHIYSTGDIYPFNGWSTVTVITSALGAAGGLLVALCIKHLDSIIKSIATSGCTVITMVVAYFLQGAPLSLESSIGAALVIMAIFNYNDDAESGKLSRK